MIDRLHLPQRGVISLVGAGGKTSLMFCLAKEIAGSGKTVLTTTTTKIFMPEPEQSCVTIVENSVENLLKESKPFLGRYAHLSAGREQDPTTGKLKGFDPGQIGQIWKAGLFDWIIVEADGARRKPIKATASHEPVVPNVTTHLILVTGLDSVGKKLNDSNVHRADIFSHNTGLEPGQSINEQAIFTSIALETKKAAAQCHPVFTAVFLNKADFPDRIASGEKIAELLKENQMVSRGINQVIIASLHNDAVKKIGKTIISKI